MKPTTSRRPNPERTKSKISSVKLQVDILGDQKSLSALHAAMAPESESGKRCKMTLHSGSDKLSMVFKAEDIVSLRASMNTNLRLVAAALKSIKAVSQSNN